MPTPEPPREPFAAVAPPRGIRRARAVLGLLVVLALAAAGYVVFWFTAASLFRQAILEWSEARRVEGMEVGFSRLDLGGFPLHLRATVAAPTLGRPLAKVPWRWRAERAVAVARPWDFTRVAVDLAGAHAVDLTLDGMPLSWRGTAAVVDAELAADGGRIGRGRVTIEGLALGPEGAEAELAVGRAVVTAAHNDDEAGDHRRPSFEASIEARGLRVPQRLNLPLGHRIDTLALQAAVLGRIPTGPPVEALAAWRDAGGTLEIRHFAIDYGPLGLQTNGTFALDAALQPIAALTAKVTGFFETVDQLRARGLVADRQATMAKVILGVLAKRPADGGPPTLNAPLTVQESTLYVGPVALAKLPPVRWPGAGG